MTDVPQCAQLAFFILHFSFCNRHFAGVSAMINRRRFLEDSLLATAAAATFSSRSLALEETRTFAAGETITAAIIGCGTRGRQQVDELARIAGVQVACVCDPDTDRMGKLAEHTKNRQGKNAADVKAIADMRRVFEDKSIDVVFVATCNHWHALAAIWAMQAGKHVYCEKPVSHNIVEGRRIVDVSRKTNRLCQAGTQRRSSKALAAAVDYMRQGKLGEVKLARSVIYGRRNSIGGPGTFEPPATVDYDLWCGPAPKSPITRPSFHYDWHWFWETGNGELGNNNIHMVDVCRWGLGVTGLGRSVLSYGGRFGYEDAARTPNTQVVIHDFGDKAIVQETRGLKSEAHGPKVEGGAIFYGTEGIIADTSLFDLDGKLIRKFEGGEGDHFANFLDAVRSGNREDLAADILEGHQSSALCHAGNISYRLGLPADLPQVEATMGDFDIADARDTFLRTAAHLKANGIDPDAAPISLGRMLHIKEGGETFGDDEANALLTREYRKPFELPA
jgi:predicted dehydrogenase